MRKYLGYFVLAALVALIGALEVIRSSAGRDYDLYQVGERKTPTWLEILAEGDEAHKNEAIDDLLSRLEVLTEDYLESRSVLMILGWADLAPAQARPVAARLPPVSVSARA